MIGVDDYDDDDVAVSDYDDGDVSIALILTFPFLTFIPANNARCDSYHSDHLVSTTGMVSRFKSQKNEPLWHVL